MSESKMNNRILIARLFRGMKISTLSNRTGISVERIRDYENGIKVPKQSDIINLAEALRIYPDFLIGGEK